MYPRLVIDTDKLTHNVTTLVKKLSDHNLTTMGVTKVFCADPKLVQCYVGGGVDYLADSRLDNLAKLADFDIPKVLLRLPSASQADDVVRLADISLNSEVSTIKALGEAAERQNRQHQIVLMIDLGDLREGIWPSDFDETVVAIKTIPGVKLIGVGVNLTCYGGVIPKAENLKQLVDFSIKLRSDYGLFTEIVSGGNSSSLYLLDQAGLPDGINNLRLGEALVLGRETAYGEPIAGTHQDVFRLQAEIIEKKTKPSLPIGDIGMDAFGNTPSFEDKGERVRAILSIGRQDVNVDNLIPVDSQIEILGASSDHLILDITDTRQDYQVGDIISFDIEYGALLSLMTSAYVEKQYS